MVYETADPRKTFGQAVLAEALTNPDIVVFSTDSGSSSGFSPFKERFPERYYEFGIMEQAAVGIASGLATTGKVPVYCAIAPFVTARPFEMFRNDLGYMRQNVKVVGRNGGFSYSQLGATHHSLEDFAIIRMIPGVVVLAPQDPGEIMEAVHAMITYDGPVYMRIGYEPIPYLFDRESFSIGKGRIVRQGSDVTLIMTGSLASEVLEAAEILSTQGIHAQVVGMPTISPLDRELIVACAAQTGRIVTVEEHYIIGGLGTMVQEVCAECSPVPVKKLGVPHQYATSGSYRELLHYYGLDAQGIAESVAHFLKQG